MPESSAPWLRRSITFRCDPREAADFSRVCAAQGVDKSSVLRGMLTSYLAENERVLADAPELEAAEEAVEERPEHTPGSLWHRIAHNPPRRAEEEDK